MESVIAVITLWYVQFCPDRLCKTSAMCTHCKLLSILLFTFASILNDTFLYAPYLTLLIFKVNSQSYEIFCRYSVRIIQLNLDPLSTVLPITFSYCLLMVAGKIISLNVRGISNYKKRRTIFTWCRKQKADIIFLQETHSTERNEVAWKREWGAPLYYSHGANNARGVVILIRNKFDCIVQESVTDADGRFLMLKVLLNGEQTLKRKCLWPKSG